MSGATAVYCGQGEMEEMQLSVDGLQAVVAKLMVRIETTERRTQYLEQVISGGVTKSAERAVTLNEAVRQKGHLKRGDVRKILNCHTMTAQRAMEEAVEMFPDLYLVKSDAKKQWVLAVRT
jgi:hypothetical protein